MKITKRNLQRLINEAASGGGNLEGSVVEVEIAIDNLRNKAFTPQGSRSVREAIHSLQSAVATVRAAIANEQETSNEPIRNGRQNRDASFRRERDAYMMDAMNADETYQDYDYSPADPRGPFET